MKRFEFSPNVQDKQDSKLRGISNAIEHCWK